MGVAVRAGRPARGGAGGAWTGWRQRRNRGATAADGADPRRGPDLLDARRILPRGSRAVRNPWEGAAREGRGGERRVAPRDVGARGGGRARRGLEIGRASCRERV